MLGKTPLTSAAHGALVAAIENALDHAGVRNEVLRDADNRVTGEISFETEDGDVFILTIRSKYEAEEDGMVVVAEPEPEPVTYPEEGIRLFGKHPKDLTDKEWQTLATVPDVMKKLAEHGVFPPPPKSPDFKLPGGPHHTCDVCKNTTAEVWPYLKERNGGIVERWGDDALPRPDSGESRYGVACAACIQWLERQRHNRMSGNMKFGGLIK